MITPERMEELDRTWNESNLMDDEEYREWYEDLTAEEQATIDDWDKRYARAVLQLCNEILAREEGTA